MTRAGGGPHRAVLRRAPPSDGVAGSPGGLLVAGLNVDYRRQVAYRADARCGSPCRSTRCAPRRSGSATSCTTGRRRRDAVADPGLDPDGASTTSTPSGPRRLYRDGAGVPGAVGAVTALRDPRPGRSRRPGRLRRAGGAARPDVGGPAARPGPARVDRVGEHAVRRARHPTVRGQHRPVRRHRLRDGAAHGADAWSAPTTVDPGSGGLWAGDAAARDTGWAVGRRRAGGRAGGAHRARPRRGPGERGPARPAGVAAGPDRAHRERSAGPTGEGAAALPVRALRDGLRRPGDAGEVRVSATASWLRLDARYGAVVRRRVTALPLLV